MSVNLYPPSTAAAGGFLVVLAFTLLGCGQGSREIDKTRVVPGGRPLAPASSAERFGVEERGASAAAEQPSFAYDLPPGWTMAAPRQFREPNLLVAGNPDAECYVTILSSGGGGIVPNINRWRGQMGLAPLSEAEIGGLPRQRLPRLGEGAEAIVLDVEGAYGGMGAATPKEGYRFVGAIVMLGSWGVFVRMSGPKELLAAERKSFDAFLASLRPTAAAPAAEPQGPQMTWTAPAAWKEGPAKAMREVTFLVGESGKTECYLALAGGGLLANVNRWRAQMGQDPLDEAAAGSLPEMELMGRPARLVEIAGDYKGMGDADIPGAKMLGVVCPTPTVTLFVKMTGPAAEVEANRERFQEFCKSLRMK